MRRRPPGDDVTRPRQGVWYRHPMYEKGHLYRGDGDAWCGRPLLVDPLWWFDSGWENQLGSLWLVADTRAGGRCGSCRDTAEAMRGVVEPPRPSPLDEGEQERVRIQGRGEEMRWRAVAEWLARQFNGEVLDVAQP